MNGEIESHNITDKKVHVVSYQHTETRELIEESTEDLKAETLTQTRALMMGRTIANTVTAQNWNHRGRKKVERRNI